MKNKITVTIGIPAYNAEKRIKRLLRSLVIQKEITIYIERILVYSDCGSDNTVKKAQEINDKRIKVISAETREGFAHAVDVLTHLSTSDLFILLNDDIYITDSQLIEKMSKPLLINKKLGLIGGDHQPLYPRNFVEKAITSTYWAYKNTAIHYKNGNNLFTVDGKLVGMTKEYIKKLSFPSDYAKVGNLDVYLYLLCLKNNFYYIYVDEAKVYFKNPNKLTDYIRWSLRNNRQKQLMSKLFSNNLISEFSLPQKYLQYYSFIEFLKNPLGTIFILGVGRYIKFKAKNDYKTMQKNWEVITSSK